MPAFHAILRGLLVAALLLTAVPCWAQRVRFPTAAGSTSNAALQQPGFSGSTTPGFSGSTTPGMVPVQPSVPTPGTTPPAYTTPNYGTPSYATPGASTPGTLGTTAPGYTTPGSGAASSAPALLGQPTFDPFRVPATPATQPPSLGAPPSSAGVPPASAFGAPSQPLYTAPGSYGGAGGFPQQPSTLYPNGYPYNWNQGLFSPNGLFGGQGGMAQPGPYVKLLENLRVIHTWVSGNGVGRSLSSNDIELATTMNMPNFLLSHYPLSISPGFIFQFWNGPSPPILVDLPARVYSSYLNFAWNPLSPSQRFGAELSGTVGLFTDFHAINSHSIRVITKTLFVYNLTPTFTIKGGVEYLDRVRIKLLPAGGVVWKPNDRVYFDIYFPRPKLAQYLVTVGTTEVWWYVGGEYGYGSWTIDRGIYGSNRTDVNDIRLLSGLEWVNKATTLKGFIEAGYVFNREVRFAERPQDDFTLQDAFMLRSGLAF